MSPHRRPEWSFLWLQAPLRSLRYGIWRQHRCRISLGLALLLLLALLLTFIYAAPVSLGGTATPPDFHPHQLQSLLRAPLSSSLQGYLAMKVVNPLQSLHLAGGEHPAGSAGKP